jgi:hypothetical protein
VAVAEVESTHLKMLDERRADLLDERAAGRTNEPVHRRA